MSLFVVIIAGILSGIAASLGVGGGGVLILYFSMFSSIKPENARGINLLFFIPIAFISTIIHAKNNLTETKLAVKIALPALFSAAAGAFISFNINANILSKIFAGALIFAAFKEFFEKGK